MDMNRERMLREVMAADFTAIDLNLYLNTHPNDQKALTLYASSVQRAKMLRYNFERLYGPLTPDSAAYGYPWRWIQDPWPWQKQ